MNINANEMMDCINYAKYIYQNKRDAYNEMIIRAMKEDFSWKASAKKYGELYDELVDEKKETEKQFKNNAKRAKK